MKKRSKRYQELAKKIDQDKLYPIEEAVKLAKETSLSSFKGSIEVHINLLEKIPAIQVDLPHGTGKTVRVAVFASGEAAKEAKDAGADIVGDSDLVEKVQNGFTDFDVAIAVPDMMPKLARLGKVLGPKGLMPNPKTGTITTHIKEAVKRLTSGQVTVKTEANLPLIHMTLGSTSFSDKQLQENMETLITTIGPTKIKKTVLSATMGPGIKVLVK
ncbi:MAG TPA: 50S ribosomal protein L1 [Patescibacteria group bacterium]|nr:50S ribosomal protein L1 [Patescibacteria group bacterium]